MASETKVIVVCLLLICSYIGLTKSKPNIVVILADDLGWNDASFHGSDVIPTPNIDALAYTGTILQRHYVLPMCTPSRAAFLTGRYPLRYGLQGYPLRTGEKSGLPLNETILPQYLKELGYGTHLLGKWHLGFSSKEYTPCQRGFDTWLGYYSGLLGYYNYGMSQNVAQLNTAFYGLDIHDCQNESRSDLVGKYITETLTDRAEEIIGTQDGDKPFFLFLSHNAVHNGNSSLSPEGLEPPTDVNVNETFGHIAPYERRLLAAMLTSLDESVGRIVSALQRKNILENTVILFLSDNGAPTVSAAPIEPNFSSNWPLRGVKFTLFEGGVRGLALIWSPLIGKGEISHNWIHMTDWLSTLYTIAGGDANNLKNVDGKNKLKQIRGNKSYSSKSPIFLNMEENYEAVIVNNRYKVIRGGYDGQANYEKYSGCERASVSPQYDVEKIKNSKSGTAILKLKNYTAMFEENKINELRSNATIKCDVTCLTSFGYVNNSEDKLCSDLCVFDLLEDPCEINDISQTNLDILELGKYYLNEMKQFLVYPINDGVVDPRSNPDLHDGNWVPWIVPDRPKCSLL